MHLYTCKYSSIHRLPWHGTSRDCPRNPGILSVPGSMDPLTWDIPGHCRPGTCPVYLGIPKDVLGQVVAVLGIPRGQIVVVIKSCRWMHICTLIQKQPSPDRQEIGYFLGAFSCWQHPVTTPVRRRLDSTKSLGFPPVL